jgi:putative tricarboxylic transport membrane protein
MESKMTKIDKLGLGGGIFVLTVAVVFFVYSLQYPYSSELGPGAGMLPIWLSGLLILLALAYIFSVYKGTDSGEEMPDKKAQKEMLFILASMGLFVLLMPVLGFNLNCTLFLFAFLRRGYKWYTALAISVGASVFLYLMFTKGFGTPMPTNMFGF